MELKNFVPNDNEKIASGIYADVYRCDGWAIKIFKEARSKTEIFYEALVSAQVESTGLPVPRVRTVTRLANKQWVIATQFANGKTLFDLMKQNNDKISSYIDTLINLQLEIHKKNCPKLIKMKDNLKSQINNLNELGNTSKFELMERLEGLEKHTCLVHGNLSPSNIIINQDGSPMIVDWFESSQGNPLYDIAKTYILLNLEFKETASIYLDKYIEKTKTEKKSIEEWLPIVAALQLRYAKKEQKELLLHWIDVVQYF